MNELDGAYKENRYLVAVILLSIAIFVGQVVDAGAFSLENLPDAFRAVFDPMQFMVGMLIISFIFVITSIRKYELIPNPLLNIIKWYFSIVLINDFIVLVFRVVQKSNILSFTNSFSGTGKLYLILASMRSITDLTISSAAVCLLVYGLARYKFVHDDGPLSANRMGRIILIFVVIRWVFSIPVNMTGLLTNQRIFVVSLIVSLLAGLVSMVLIYLMVKQQRNRHKTTFFKNLTRYFSIGLLVVALNFIYSISSFGLIQRFPAGEIEMLGGFGKLVLFITLVSQAVQNYYMYKALDGYNEDEAVVFKGNAAVELPHAVMTGE